MGVIKGKITNKFGEPVEKATVALKDKDFEDFEDFLEEEAAADANYLSGGGQ